MAEWGRIRDAGRAGVPMIAQPAVARGRGAAPPAGVSDYLPFAVSIFEHAVATSDVGSVPLSIAAASALPKLPQ
jgi:hypothetical protein